MWTSKNRGRYDRSKLRYPSDLTDDEWELVEHLIPPGKPGGGKRTVIMREVVNGLMYVLSTGCQWRAIPKDLPPKSTIYEYFDLWTYDGTLERIHHALYEQCREQARREASPTAAIIDSQMRRSDGVGRNGGGFSSRAAASRRWASMLAMNSSWLAPGSKPISPRVSSVCNSMCRLQSSNTSCASAPSVRARRCALRRARTPSRTRIGSSGNRKAASAFGGRT